MGSRRVQQADSPPSFETQIRVRYCDTDAMGFLHHARYLEYFEVARTEWLRSLGGNYREMERKGLFFVVVEAHCRYRAPAQYDDLLTLRTLLERRSAAKLVHRYEVYRDDQLLAEGRTVLACVDADGNVVRIPELVQGEADE